MTSEILKRIIPHSEFQQLVGTIDKVIAERGFAPKEHYNQIYRYQAEHADDRRGYEMLGYWHTNVPIEDPEDMHKHYYMNAKKQTIHLSVKIAETLDERNEVHFGGNSPVATKQLKTFVAKLRRFAKKANEEIKRQAELYYRTPMGISEKLNTTFYEFKDATKSLMWRSNYNNVIESSGSSWMQIVRNDMNNKIGKLEWENPSYGYKKPRPMEVTFVIFFEDPDLQQELEDLAKPIYEQMKLHNEQVRLAEEELVVNKLKGIEETQNDSPF